MLVKRWDKLPEDLQRDAVRPYYDILRKRKVTLVFKRLFDIVMSIILLVFLSPLFLIVALLIKHGAPGPIFYRQERVTQYGRLFRIYKFRTMVVNADQIGSLVTTTNDTRVTTIGKKLRRYRIDEIPQLLNIITGDMTFVGTRPEVPKYVAHYTDEMKATLLLPAGVTSQASIEYKDEEQIIREAEDIDTLYIERVLPEKMRMNLGYLGRITWSFDMCVLIRTMLSVFI